MQSDRRRLRVMPPPSAARPRHTGHSAPISCSGQHVQMVEAGLERGSNPHRGRRPTSRKTVNAEAFTAGGHVVLASASHLFPLTATGNHLLAHELAHVAQDPGRSPRSVDRIALSEPDDAVEKNAEDAARLRFRQRLRGIILDRSMVEQLRFTAPPRWARAAVQLPYPRLKEQPTSLWSSSRASSRSKSSRRAALWRRFSGPAEPHTSRFWPASQIAWGAALTDDGTTVSFFDAARRRWVKTTDLPKPFTRTDILDAEQVYGRPRAVPRTWDLNDFGPLALQIEATAEFIHTTPDTESGNPLAGPSHGCIHILPADRDAMISKGYLQAGVKLIVKSNAPVSEPRQRTPCQEERYQRAHWVTMLTSASSANRCCSVQTSPRLRHRSRASTSQG